MFIFQEGKWVWARTQEPIIYNNWKANEPNNVGRIENCLHLFRSFEWNDYPCGRSEYQTGLRPLCQIFE